MLGMFDLVTCMLIVQTQVTTSQTTSSRGTTGTRTEGGLRSRMPVEEPDRDAATLKSICLFVCLPACAPKYRQLWLVSS